MKKVLKKILAISLALTMCVGLAACGSSTKNSSDTTGTGTQSSTGDSTEAGTASSTTKVSTSIGDGKKIKVGVLVIDSTGAEALAFRRYYEDYLAKTYDNVELIYSDNITDANGAVNAVKDMYAQGCSGILSLCAYGETDMIKLCEDYGMYFSKVTGMLDATTVDLFRQGGADADFKYTIGSVGPTNAIEKDAGEAMIDYFFKAGQTSFVLSGGAPTVVECHAYRATGWITGILKNAGSGTSIKLTNGSDTKTVDATTNYDDIEQLLYAGYYTPAQQVGGIKIVGWVNSFQGESAPYNPNYKTELQSTVVSDSVILLADVMQMSIVKSAIEGAGAQNVLVGGVGAYVDDYAQYIQSGDLDYMAGKYSSGIGVNFAQMMYCITHKDATARIFFGTDSASDDYNLPCRLGQGYWVASAQEIDGTQMSAYDCYQLYMKADSVTDPAYNQAVLNQYINADTMDYKTFANWVSCYSYKDLSNIKNYVIAGGTAQNMVEFIKNGTAYPEITGYTYMK